MSSVNITARQGRDVPSRRLSNRHRPLVIAVLTMAAIAAVGVPAQAQSFRPINVWKSSHCLDNATENNAKLQMWSCSGHSEQTWLEGFDPQTSLFTFQNGHTNWCINAPGGAGTVTMAPCDGSTNQQWRVFFADNPLGPPSGWYDIWQNVASGLCLATPSVANGTLPQMETCDLVDQFFRWHSQ
jgi:ricin-type beta-trefoil lectin protein